MGRWFYVLLRGLVERGHRVTTFVVCHTAQEIEQTRELFQAQEYDLRCYLIPQENGGWAAKWRTLSQPHSFLLPPELQADLETELANGCDILHLEALWSAWLGWHHAERVVVSVPYLFQIDLDHRPAASLRDRVRRHVTFRGERQILRHYQTITTVSPRLSEYVRAINPTAYVQTIPFGLELSFYPFKPDRQSDEPSAVRPPTIGLIGSFDWSPGYLAGRRLLSNLWPEIKRRVPSVTLEIAGRQARSAFGEYVGLSDVRIDNEVPSVPEFFNRMDVLLYPPNQGSGIKFKVMESFAFGVPVVSTQDGVEGLPVKDGVQAGVCEDDEGLIARTVTLLNDPAQRHKQRHAARALIERHCGPEPTLNSIEAVYQQIVGKND